MLATVRNWLEHRTRPGRSRAIARPSSPVDLNGEGDTLAHNVVIFTIQHSKQQQQPAATIETNVSIEQQQQQQQLPSKPRWRRLVRRRRRHQGGNEKDKQNQSKKSLITKLARFVCCCCDSGHDHKSNEWHPRTSTTTTTSVDNIAPVCSTNQQQQHAQVNDNINDVIINRLCHPHHNIVVNNSTQAKKQASLDQTQSINQIDETERTEKMFTESDAGKTTLDPASIITTTYHIASTSNYVPEVTPSSSNQRPRLDLTNFVNAKLNEPSSSSVAQHASRSKIVPYVNELHPKVSYIPWRRTTNNSAFVSQQLEVSSKRLMKEIGDIMRKQQQHQKEQELDPSIPSLPFTIELVDDSLYEWNIHIHRFDDDSQVSALAL